MTTKDNKGLRDHWVFVALIGEVPRLGSRKITIDNHRIALFKTAKNKIFALEDSCPHSGGPLSEGIVHGHCVTCPLHNWVISLEDGTAQGADSGQTRRFEVKLDGERIFLNRLPESIVQPPEKLAVLSP